MGQAEYGQIALGQFTLPDKLYYKIGEVAKIVGVEPYVLRYWETEFPEISPIKSKSRQRLYKRQDVAVINEIRNLLYKNKYTIKGAKSKIKEIKREMRNPEALQGKLDVTPAALLDDLCVDELKSIVGEMEAFLQRN